MLPEHLSMPCELPMSIVSKPLQYLCRFGAPVRRLVSIALCHLVVLFSASSLRAEPPPTKEQSLAQKVWMGARLGLASSWIRGSGTDEDITDYSMKVGLLVGALAQLELTSALSLRLEPAYVAKGAHTELTTTGRSGETRLSYVTTPVLLRLSPYRHRYFATYGLLGPEMGFLLGCRSVSPDRNEDCSGVVKTVDFGIVAGLGIAVMLPWGALIAFEVEYDHALISHFDREGFEADYKNSAVLFSIGYSHRIGGADPR